MDRNVPVCQSPTHEKGGTNVIATIKLPCNHTFCDWCVRKSKSKIGNYIVCLKCAKHSAEWEIHKFERRAYAGKEIVRNDDKTKKEEDKGISQKKTMGEQCEDKYCLKNHVYPDDIILLSCKHNFCHRCLFWSSNPKISTEKYCLIKCPNCKDDERWYADEDLQPPAAKAKENFEYHKKISYVGSFKNEIKCFMKENTIHLEFKLPRSSKRAINIWSSLRERMHTVNVSPDKSGLFTADIPIEGEIYFFKIYNPLVSSDIETKWVGPVDVKRGIPPKIEGIIEVENVSTHSAKLSWKGIQAYKYIDVYGYSIELRLAGDQNWEKFDFLEDPTSSFYAVNDLKDKSHYELRLNVFSSVGHGEYAKCSFKTMPETETLKAIPCTPCEFRIQYTGFNEGMFSWKEPPYVLSNKVMEYILEFREENGNWKKAADVRDQCSVSCPFKKMTEKTNYFFRISARNVNGKSEPCEFDRPVKRKPPIVSSPEKFDVEILSDKAKLFWNIPSGMKCNGKIEYVVEFKEEYSDIWLLLEQTDRSFIFVCPTRMIIDKGYNFRVMTKFGLTQSKSKVLACLLSKNSDNGIVKIQHSLRNNIEITHSGSHQTKQGENEEEKKRSDSGNENKKQPVNKNEEESCSKCLESKSLECSLSCGHKYCLECSFNLAENATECFDGIRSVFMWSCNKCDFMTGESFIKFIGTFLSKDTLLETREKLEKQKPKTNDQEDYLSYESEGNATQKFRIRGLPNVGMTCYSNCIFQILAQTNNFCDHLEGLLVDYNLDKNTSVIGLLKRILMEINRDIGNDCSNRVDYETVVRLIERISRSDQYFQRGEQADSHSFMMTLFNQIKDEIQAAEEHSCESETKQLSLQTSKATEGEKIKIEGSQGACSLLRNTGGVSAEKQAKINKEAPLSQFEGITANIFSYKSCKHRELTEKQIFNSLLIPIKSPLFGSWTLCEGLQVLQDEQTFSKNMVPCGKCTFDQACNYWYNKTTKHQIFTHLPNVLVLQLGKFEKNYGFSVRKIYSIVDYPLELKLKECKIPELEDPKLKFEYSEKTYRLFGVTLHTGTLYGGHYSAYVRCKNNDTEANTQDDAEWFYCSDLFVEKKSEKDVINDSRASVLFYELIDSSAHL